MVRDAVIYLKQKGLLCDRKGKRANVIPLTQEAPLMRLSVASLRRAVKGDLRIEFVRQDLTSYGGLELLRRYVRRIGVRDRLRAAEATMGGGDYGGVRLSLLILSLFYVGARRLEQLRYLAGDPLIMRFCGLARLPSARTVVNWLKQFTQSTLAPLVQLNRDLVLDTVTRLQLSRLTIDVDGTVVCTGATVAWAFRGFNPHHRKHLSYYPLLAHLAQTGHILRLKNRPGNVHDSKQAVAFLRDLIDDLRARLGRRVPLEFRMDAAFCQPDIFRLLVARGCAYAIKVGYWHWLPLKQLATERQRWLPVAPNVTGFFHDLDIPQWHLRLRVMIYRKHVQHESPKNFQLDLFTPDDGHFEYAAVATNLAVDLPALYAFICGRGAQEKTLAELKGEFALDVVPTNHYGANSAWQQLSILAHNIAVASSSTRSPSPSRALANAPTPMSFAASAHCAFCSSPGPAG
jgi:Transposase DDE domain group 1